VASANIANFRHLYGERFAAIAFNAAFCLKTAEGGCAGCGTFDSQSVFARGVKLTSS
jgi:hypothetical protein